MTKAGNGQLILTPGAGYLNFSGFSGFNQISFAPGAEWMLAGVGAGPAIAGFSSGDTLRADGFDAASERFIPGTGLVLTGNSFTGGAMVTLNITGSFSSADFGLSFPAVVSGEPPELYTDITIIAACFCPGTRIATPRGKRPVESLRIGDEVLTLHGGAQAIKWIGKRAYAAPFAKGDFIRPLIIHANALAAGVPCADLRLSPGHALFLAGGLVPAWRLLNGVSITQAAPGEPVEYVHIELEAQEIIFAEDCPVESFHGAPFRSQFHNAAEFSRLYPDALDHSPCLPRLESGFALAALQAQLNAHAGLPPPSQALGPLRGYVDIAGPDSVAGWAQDFGAPERPVVLDILCKGQRLGRVLANAYREDLRAARLGSGCHGFSLPLAPPAAGPVSVRRAQDGAALPRTEAAQAAA